MKQTIKATVTGIWGLLLFGLFGFATHASQNQKWVAAPPGFAKDSADWIQLISDLQSRGFHAGAFAAGGRMLMYFADIETKEAAYRAILNTVDQGYPFSVFPLFQAGDLAPVGDYEFVNGYNFYKAILNRDRGLEKWAKYYFEGVDKANYRKYLFVLAIEAYLKKDYATSQQKLKELLTKDFSTEQTAFVRKVARTLARSYFDQEEYAKAHDIYAHFLLKTPTVDPRDWLEDAWCLYYLKRFQESLGMLYNLESQIADKFITIEKFTLRGLIYRSLCAVSNAEQLAQSFQKDFGDILTGIKRGRPLTQFPKLASIDLPSNSDYIQIVSTIDWLNVEQAELRKIPEKSRKLAAYLYKTEIQMLGKKMKLYYNVALERAAMKLIMMDENLRFLKFSVQRERYNPDSVFKTDSEITLATPPQSGVDESSENIRIRWLQNGDFWKDERLRYEGSLPNRCSE